ncbi:PLC-like phosphodiesterase [Boeremia exigua]|uniref:PLC-like phosphodiesterase n=1 Tax=Boeremia exigua TaxID=749465 RepID=UPI001E8E70A0|nr:PLC-like phosphodiesterase [Boeremia exigua]KAH6644263.1 PLC-like phosphodiesterase [Boeremia exigua]
MFFRSIIAASALLFSATTAQNACNNSPSLCPRAYNNITHLGAHDSPFLRNENTSFSTSGNHYYDTITQLDAGVRLLSAQVHKSDNGTGADEWHLCHSSCDLLDAGTLESWLSTIKTWMDRNTNDVVTILLVNSASATGSDLGAQFNSSGISQYAYTPPSTGVPTTWPTLDALIGNGTRLMTFVASLSQTSPQYPFLMDEFTYIFENNFENVNPSNYSCTPSRPTGLTTSSTGGRMFLMNHFLYSTQLFGIQSPNETYANTTNAQTGFGSLGTSVSNCSTVYGKAPWAVLVDFFNVGPAIASVDAANGVSGSISGRRSLTTEPLKESSQGGVARAQGSLFAVIIAVVVAVSFGL